MQHQVSTQRKTSSCTSSIYLFGVCTRTLTENCQMTISNEISSYVGNIHHLQTAGTASSGHDKHLQRSWNTLTPCSTHAKCLLQSLKYKAGHMVHKASGTPCKYKTICPRSTITIKSFFFTFSLPFQFCCGPFLWLPYSDFHTDTMSHLCSLFPVLNMADS